MRQCEQCLVSLVVTHALLRRHRISTLHTCACGHGELHPCQRCVRSRQDGGEQSTWLATTTSEKTSTEGSARACSTQEQKSLTRAVTLGRARPTVRRPLRGCLGCGTRCMTRCTQSQPPRKRLRRLVFPSIRCLPMVRHHSWILQQHEQDQHRQQHWKQHQQRQQHLLVTTLGLASVPLHLLDVDRAPNYPSVYCRTYKLCAAKRTLGQKLSLGRCN